MSLNSILCKRNIFGYCYHSVKRISYGRAQSDIPLSGVHCNSCHGIVLANKSKVCFVFICKQKTEMVDIMFLLTNVVGLNKN